MTSWALPISGDFEHHWDIARSMCLETCAPAERSGLDVIYFWRSGAGGFVGRAVVSADARPLAENEIAFESNGIGDDWTLDPNSPAQCSGGVGDRGANRP